MYRPVLVLLSMAALLQAGVASPIDSREVSAEAGYLRQTDAYLADPSKREAEAQCFCTKDYNPVCASGKTYSNKCTANCDGAKAFTQGACEVKAQCICTFDYNPVCVSGKTYANKCTANCDGAKQFTEGAC